MSAWYVLFFSTHHALWAESVLKEANLAPQLVAVPRQLSSDCGYCVRVAGGGVQVIAAALASAGVQYDRIVQG